jgi:hypothetical protein
VKELETLAEPPASGGDRVSMSGDIRASPGRVNTGFSEFSPPIAPDGAWIGVEV